MVTDKCRDHFIKNICKVMYNYHIFQVLTKNNMYLGYQCEYQVIHVFTREIMNMLLLTLFLTEVVLAGIFSKKKNVFHTKYLRWRFLYNITF